MRKRISRWRRRREAGDYAGHVAKRSLYTRAATSDALRFAPLVAAGVALALASRPR